MHPMLNIGIQAARNASRIILRYIDQVDTLSVDMKKKNDFVTQVDKMSEQDIINTIHKAYPDHSILAEESGFEKLDDEYCWIIDPLDGTANFIHGIPQFAISIALKHRGDVIVGVVFDPIKQELFTAAKGSGAHLNNRRIRVSQIKQLELGMIGTGFPFRHPEHVDAYFRTLNSVFHACGDIRRAGAAALDLAYVAAGRLDGHWEFSLETWDLAAGTLLVKEAGGMVSDFSGKDKYLENGQIIAGNPKIFKALHEVLQPSLNTQDS